MMSRTCVSSQFPQKKICMPLQWKKKLSKTSTCQKILEYICATKNPTKVSKIMKRSSPTMCCVPMSTTMGIRQIVDEIPDTYSFKSEENTESSVVEGESYLICFDIHDFERHFNFAQYCIALSWNLFQFKNKFDELPSNFSLSEYECWKKLVFETYYDKIQTYPAYYKLLEQLATSKKVGVYLKSTSDLLIKLVFDLPLLNSKNIGEKKKLVEIFASISEAMGIFLQKLSKHLSRIALVVIDGKKHMKYYEDDIRESVNKIFNLVRYFKTLLHGDLPYYDDLVKWAYDLREYAFEICLCSPYYSSVVV